MFMSDAILGHTTLVIEIVLSGLLMVWTIVIERMSSL